MADRSQRDLLNQYEFTKRIRMRDGETGLVRDVIEGPTNKGGRASIKIPPADQTTGRLRAALLNKDFSLPNEDKLQTKLLEALRDCKPKEYHQHELNSGWNSDQTTFVVQQHIVGQPARGQLGIDPDLIPQKHQLNTSGTIEGWKDSIAAYATVSSAMIVCMSTAFAAPLLEMRGEKSFGVCVSGDSRGGKSLAAMMAASAIGWDDRDLPTWDMTDAGMDRLLGDFKDLLVPIDDIMSLKGGHAVQLKQLNELSYKLATGRPRARHQRFEKENGAEGTWRCIVLTSSEKPLDELRSGHSRPKGATVRMIDMPAILDGDDMFDGLETAPGQDRVKQQSDLYATLIQACKTNHGWAIQHYLAHLIACRATLGGHIKELVDEFIEGVSHSSDTNLTRDVARKFGLLYAGARIATEAGTVDWSRDAVINALRRAYHAARQRLPDDALLLREGCQLLRKALQRLPAEHRLQRSKPTETVKGYRYRRARMHHCLIRNEAFVQIFSSYDQCRAVEDWLIQEGKVVLAHPRTGKVGNRRVKKQHHWEVTGEKRVRSLHIMWPMPGQKTREG